MIHKQALLLEILILKKSSLIGDSVTFICKKSSPTPEIVNIQHLKIRTTVGAFLQYKTNVYVCEARKNNYGNRVRSTKVTITDLDDFRR